MSAPDRTERVTDNAEERAMIPKHPNDPHVILTTAPGAVITCKRVAAPEAAGPIVKVAISVPYAEVVAYLDREQAGELRDAIAAELDTDPRPGECGSGLCEHQEHTGNR